VWQIITKEMTKLLGTVIYFLKISTNTVTRTDEFRDIKIREFTRVEAKPYATHNI
jgi:hypothetical protein